MDNEVKQAILERCNELGAFADVTHGGGYPLRLAIGYADFIDDQTFFFCTPYPQDQHNAHVIKFEDIKAYTPKKDLGYGFKFLGMPEGTSFFISAPDSRKEEESIKAWFDYLKKNEHLLNWIEQEKKNYVAIH